MNEEQARQFAKQVADASPEGDWYLLPPGAHKVVGYLTVPDLGEVAYKGKPMNIRAVLEEAIYQALIRSNETT